MPTLTIIAWGRSPAALPGRDAVVDRTGPGKKRGPVKAPFARSWHHCAICGEPTRDALCGNRLLPRLDVTRLPTEQVPAVSWRCRKHQQYHMRAATAVSANGLGDLLFALACGHTV